MFNIKSHFLFQLQCEDEVTGLAVSADYIGNIKFWAFASKLMISHREYFKRVLFYVISILWF
jgi:hypothetical protein